MTKPINRAQKILAVAELTIAANTWGFGFIATIWALSSMGPVWLTALRFILAAACMIPIIFLIPATRKQFTWENLRTTFPPGLFLSLTLVLQTWGLRYTTATKCGFITTLYVILVPVLERFFYKRRLTGLQVFCIFVALLGTALIANLRSLENLNIGDFLTLLCAFAAAFHILSVGHFSNHIRSAVVFNTMQSLWAGILPLFLAMLWEPLPSLQLYSLPMAGFLFLTFGSTCFAFMLQIRAQKYLNASVASMLFLLESPFAAIYAYFILGERMNSGQWLGAILILVAVLGSSYEESRKQNPAPPLEHI